MNMDHNRIWNKQSTMLAMTALVLGIGCQRDKEDTVAPRPHPVNEEEVITTVTLTFITTAQPPDTFEWRWVDPDGDGGQEPLVHADTLPAASDLTMHVRVLNESMDPVDDITEEIAEEGVDHQFFFLRTGAAPAVAYDDVDANGRPIGLRNTAVTTNGGVGTLTVILRHQPDKTGAGVSTGDITHAGGETDLEVVFPVVVH